MRAEYVNAFLVPAVQVVRKMARMEVRVGQISRLEEVRLCDNLCIVIGVHGRLSGNVILTAPRDVAWDVARRIAGRALEPEDEEEEVRAIFSELANTIAGNATGYLFEIGLRESISPPIVVTEAEIYFGHEPSIQTVRVALETEAGEVVVIVSLCSENP